MEQRRVVQRGGPDVAALVHRRRGLADRGPAVCTYGGTQVWSVVPGVRRVSQIPVCREAGDSSRSAGTTA